MPYELSGLEDKVAVVTGAGRMRSIGRRIAVELARAGCHVVVVGSGRSPETYPDEEREAGWRDVDSVAEEIEALGRRGTAAVADLSDPGAVDRLADRVMQEYGRVDILVNNAASSRGADRVPVTELPVEEWHKVMNVNLHGKFYASREFGRRLIAQGRGGSIANISAIGAKWMPPNAAAYVSSKAAVMAMTACMAQEVGPHRIRVNAVLPGMIETSRMDEMVTSGVWDEMLKAMVPLGRASNGDDIAWMVVYLCSDQGEWITGQCYNVDGGHIVAR